jgi:tripartite-type tricarboxylate transporter receptor subunit TctC
MTNKEGRMTNLNASRRFHAVALGAALLAVGGVPAAQAQDYPHQTIKIVVPFAPGGGVDVVARIIVPKLTEELGQSVIIENRGGAGGMLGAAAVAQAAADGYTFLLGTGSTHGTNSAVYTKVSYDPIRDFAPVVLVSQSPLLMVVRPSLPAKSVTEFIELARSSPGKLTFGSYGTGSINHLGAELFNSMAKIQTNHVPYRGSAPALTDLIGGRLDYTFDGVSTSARCGCSASRGLPARPFCPTRRPFPSPACPASTPRSGSDCSLRRARRRPRSTRSTAK